METSHEKKRGNTFLWGLVIGVLITSLLTTKRGRQILRELTNLAIELFEDFAESTAKAKTVSKEDTQDTQEDINQAKEDIESEITEIETREDVEIKTEDEPSPVHSSTENGHHPKKRIFRGIRRK